MLVLSVNVVGSFPSFVRPIKKTSVFWIPQQKLTDPSVSSSYCNVDCGVSSLLEKQNVTLYVMSFWLSETEETAGKRDIP